MVVPKPASTIMLARDQAGKLEVLLVKRNKALSFAGGVWVFPGGKIEADEFERGNDDLDAAKLAAARETKEETNLDIGTQDLIFYRHWTTPANSPKRFATWFFFGDANQSGSEVRVDESEIISHQWIHPQDALDQLIAGKLYLMPPTFISLQLIRHCQTAAEAWTKLRKEPCVHVLPVMHMENDEMVLMYEGDAGYTAGNPNIEGPRHRLVQDIKARKLHFEYQDCEGVFPVNGGDDFFG